MKGLPPRGWGYKGDGNGTAKRPPSGGAGVSRASDRTVTTRDGFVTEFNAQSDAEAKAYKAGWVDCLSEIRDEDGLWEDHIEAVWQFARAFAKTSGDGPSCECVSCRAVRAVQFHDRAARHAV